MNPLLLQALGWTFLDFLWQGALVGAGTALAFWAFASPRARYALGCLALALCLALPAFNVASRLRAARTAPIALVAAGLRGPAAAAASPTPAPRLRRPSERVHPGLAWVVFLWAAGVAVGTLRLSSGLLWTRTLRLPATEAPAAWKARALSLARTLGIARPVTILVSGTVDSPLSFGWWRPVVLLPAALVSGMDPLLLEALLAHELAHVRRLDYLANLLQTIVEVLLFFHPCVWWISRRIRLERELLCDDLAGEALGEPRRLGLALRELDLFQLATTHLAQAAHGGNLMNRIKRLFTPQPAPAAWKPAAAVLVLALGATAACAMTKTQARPAGQQAEKPKDMAFAIVDRNDHGTTRSGNAPSDRELRDLKTRLGKDYVWFRQGGKPFVVTDPEMVAKAHDLYRPVNELGQHMGELGGVMGKLGGHLNELGSEQGKWGAQQGAWGAKQGEFGRKQGELGRQQGDLARKLTKLELRLDSDNLSGTERASLERQQNELNRRMEDLEKEMEVQEKAMEEAEKPMEDLEKRMDALEAPMDAVSKQMDELGKQMDDLGKRMDAASKAADAAMAKLMQEALASGKAQPAK